MSPITKTKKQGQKTDRLPKKKKTIHQRPHTSTCAPATQLIKTPNKENSPQIGTETVETARPIRCHNLLNADPPHVNSPYHFIPRHPSSLSHLFIQRSRSSLPHHFTRYIYPILDSSKHYR